LWQQLFLNPFRRNWTAGFPQNLVLAFLVATASYYLIESPFLRIKDRLRTRTAQRQKRLRDFSEDDAIGDAL